MRRFIRAAVVAAAAVLAVAAVAIAATPGADVRLSNDSPINDTGTYVSDYTLVTGTPYVDVWEAVKPAAVGIAAWPTVPRGQSWKEGVCKALGWGEPWEGWRRVLAAVDSYTDLEVPLLSSVERLIDFVTEPGA